MGRWTMPLQGPCGGDGWFDVASSRLSMLAITNSAVFATASCSRASGSVLRACGHHRSDRHTSYAIAAGGCCGRFAQSSQKQPFRLCIFPAKTTRCLRALYARQGAIRSAYPLHHSRALCPTTKLCECLSQATHSHSHGTVPLTWLRAVRRTAYVTFGRREQHQRYTTKIR